MVVHVPRASDGIEPIGFTGNVGGKHGESACGFVGVFGEGAGAGHGDFVRHHFYAGISIIVEFGFANTPAFGGDEDYAVGSAHTVNGSRRSIFEHIDGKDISGVDVSDIVGDNSIHHIKGFCTTNHRARSTDSHVGSGAGRTGVGDLHAGHF